MADDLLSYEIFWTRDEQENDVNDNHRVHNRRQPTKMQAHHPNDHHQIPEKDVPLSKQGKPKKDKKTSQVKEKPSLKDLRPEDKKRVANLIRELAKAGEEKEVAVEQLQVERLEFEHRMTELQQQMDVITQEREIVQKQYLDCQQLLADYQKQLAEEQEKASRMDQEKICSPSKTPHSRHSSLPQGLLQQGYPPQRNSPGYAQPSHQPTAHPQSLQQEFHHHQQPSLNGYPPPNRNGQIPPANLPHAGYQPLIFNQQPDGYEGVPSKHFQQNGLPYGNHLPRRMDLNAPNGEVDFEPILSSTHRPAQQQHGRSRHRGAGHVSRLYAGTAPEPPGKLTMSHPFPSSSPDFLLSGHSRTNSGEFQPLLPEPDNDSESSSPPDHDKNSFWPMHFDPKPNRTWPGNNQGTDTHQSQPYNPQAVPPQSFRSMSPQHRQHELLKQRGQLEQEQMWLRQKLVEQEELLALKQAQLTETELLYLRNGDKSHSLHVGNMKHHQDYYRALNVDPPPVRRHVYGLYPGSEINPISTNFPPEEFDEFGQQRVLTESMHELGFGHMMETGHPSPHDVGQMSTSSLSSASSRHRDRRRSPGQGQRYHRVRSSERPSSRNGDANGSHIGGYASFHSASKSKRKHRGSVSSSPSTVSTSTSSSNTHHRKVKHTSTSPLYRDIGAGTSPRLSLSPGKVQVTMAPRHIRSNGNTLQLTDLIDSLDGTSISRTHSKLHNRTYNGPRGQPLGSSYAVTPELFPLLRDGSDTEVEQQESRMLEEVFFVV